MQHWEDVCKEVASNLDIPLSEVRNEIKEYYKTLRRLARETGEHDYVDYEIIPYTASAIPTKTAMKFISYEDYKSKSLAAGAQPMEFEKFQILNKLKKKYQKLHSKGKAETKGQYNMWKTVNGKKVRK